MITYTIYAILIVISLITYLIGKKRGHNNLLQKINEGTGRVGIIKAEYKDSDYNRHYYYIEVKEVASAGKLIKVNVIDVKAQKGCGYSTDKLLNDFIEWVPSEDIIWYDDNSQRLRDNKLTEILGENK